MSEVILGSFSGFHYLKICHVTVLLESDTDVPFARAHARRLTKKGRRPLVVVTVPQLDDTFLCAKVPCALCTSIIWPQVPQGITEEKHLELDGIPG